MPHRVTLQQIRREMNTCSVLLRSARTNTDASRATVALANARRAHQEGMNLIERMPESEKPALIKEMEVLGHAIAELSAAVPRRRAQSEGGKKESVQPMRRI